MPKNTSPPDVEALLKRYAEAKSRRSLWEQHWNDCYEYALPQNSRSYETISGGGHRHDHLYDGTAADAVDQLAASMLAHLTPPWSRWIGIVPGPDLSESERDKTLSVFEKTAATLQMHMDRSNFTIEVHQAFLDLVTVGTACLLFEEAGPGERSAFRFTAVPLSEVVLGEGPEGRLDITYRQTKMSLSTLRKIYGKPAHILASKDDEENAFFDLLEAVEPDGKGYRCTSLAYKDSSTPVVLRDAHFTHSPYINFRWMKAAGEVYGRSPVMKALPDIRTANKVVELVLRNASIAVTGIWQADDDGILNPATVKLVPGAIIPKAQGSSGLTPLATPGRFDVSQLVLDDLRSRIRHALLIDRLGQVSSARMTATEVLERSAEMARILGATYGRLQSELLTPLILRASSILRRRGDIPNIAVDGRLVDIQHRSPLAQDQAQRDIQATLRWLESAAAMGPTGIEAVDTSSTVRWLGRALGVPSDLIRPMTDLKPTAIPAAQSHPIGSQTHKGEHHG